MKTINTENVKASTEVSGMVVRAFSKRSADAQTRLTQKLSDGLQNIQPGDVVRAFSSPQIFVQSWQAYWVDAVQRSALFWDTLRQRGDNFMEQLREGEPPVLHFDYEMVMDARTFERPVNYALVRIVPPEGVTVCEKKRPYIIFDPRAGQVPGIGGFKDDSQVGVALRAGHPVYFVIFFARPEPGQTMLDVTDVEQHFIKKVISLHPDSHKPVIVGNCQAGWAVMMLASLEPDDVGVILINGAPLSYWGGAWSEGKGNNVMRYAGGFLGGTWMASLASDLGNGLFDGAYLVQNFEGLNPGNTLWTKYRTVYKKVDTEPPRFLEFEKWWGAFSYMNREEIEWIVENLFVGNDLWHGSVVDKHGQGFDLRDIKRPIVLFASLGDNITPPQQAFNWIADTYSSTEEIKLRGQVIVGLLHQSIGHLGIFVSAKVARKEYTELFSVIKNIELLAPGLYGMEIKDNTDEDKDEKPYLVDFVEYRLEDVVERLNRFERQDEKPFIAVELLSQFNQRAYELFAQPLVQAVANEPMAQFNRIMSPSRTDKWMFSSVCNPWMAALKPIAQFMRQYRQPVDQASNVFSEMEDVISDTIVAGLDFYRDIRDALGEAWFFSVYSSPYMIQLVQQHGQDYMQYEKLNRTDDETNPEMPYVKETLAAIDQGGIIAALTRLVALLEREGDTLTLHQLEQANAFAEKYRHLLPPLTADDFRRVRGEQQLICYYAREKSIRRLPKLLTDTKDRERFLQFMDLLERDSSLTTKGAGLSAAQIRVMKRVRGVVEDAGRVTKTATAAKAKAKTGLPLKKTV